MDAEERLRARQAAVQQIYHALATCSDISKRRFERRKSAAMAAAAAVYEGLLDGAAPAKTTWVRDMLMDHTDAWETTVFPHYDDAQFLRDFRCSKATFEWLCTHIFQPCGFEGSRSGPNWRVISLRRRVAMLMWRLLHGGREHAIARTFFCDQSTVNKIVHKGLGILARRWTDVYIRWPSPERAAEIATKFQERCGLPGVVGAIDGCHVPITTPSVNRSDYFNDRAFHSMILIAAADADGYFLEIDAGLFGSLHDSQALANSRVARRASEDTWLQNQGCYLVGDAALGPPRPWLMVPYRAGGAAAADGGSGAAAATSAAQAGFNAALAAARVCVDRAFAQLKSRFRVLLKKMEGDLDTTVQMIGVCCTLHNMMLSCGEPPEAAWLEEARLMLEGAAGGAAGGAAACNNSSSRTGGGEQHQQQAAEAVIAAAGLQELDAGGDLSAAACLARATDPVPLPLGFNHVAPDELKRACKLRDTVAESLDRRKKVKTCND